MTSRSSTRGFSLIELMITIALLAFLLLIAYPGFVTMLANLRVRAVADGVLSGLQFARSEALKRNTDTIFRFTPASGVGGGWQVLLPDGTILQEKSAAEGGVVEALMTTGNNVDIFFNNLGQRSAPPSPPAVIGIDVTNPAVDSCEPSGSVRCLRVTVALGGETRLCDPRRPAGDPQAC